MKKLLVILFFFVVGVNLVYSQVVDIPDEIFKNALLGIPEINTNGDGEIQVSEASNYNGELQLENLYIVDMTGIEAFVNITGLNVRNNRIVSLDVSSNNHLTYLNCFNNYTIENLVLGDQPDLTSLQCYGNIISKIDVSPYPTLTQLKCGNNPIRVLDLRANPNLTVFDFRETQLQSLDMRNGNNTAITFIYGPGNYNLTCISVDDESYSTGNWTNIDSWVSYSADCMPYEIEFVVTNGTNPVEGAVVTMINILEVELNTGIDGIAVFDNVGDGDFIYKVEADGFKSTVSSVLVSGANETVNVVLEAGEPDVVDIPDENFKNFLLADTDININGDDNIQLTEAGFYNGGIVVNYKGISELTGIEAFVNLKNLECSQNTLNTLDLSSNTALESFDCTYSTLDSLIFGNHPNLTLIHCYGNNLKGLDLSGLPSLNTIRAGMNKISELDLTNNPNLTTFDARDNKLVSLDMRNGNNSDILNFLIMDNPDLSCVSVSDVGFAVANWTYIDEGLVFSTDCSNSYTVVFHFSEGAVPKENVHLKFGGVYYTSDASGDVTIEGVGPGTYSYSYVCQGFHSKMGLVEVNDNILENITLSAGEPSIVYIPDYNFRTYLLGNSSINTNSDSEIQLAEALSLTGGLDVSTLEIVDMTGIEAFENVTSLECSNNDIVTLDLSSNLVLTSLFCVNNYSIETLIIEELSQLESLLCYGNKISVLDLSNFSKLQYLRCGNNNFTELDLSMNKNLKTVDFRECMYLTSVDLRNGNNSGITELHAFGNPNLTCVNVSDVEFARLNWIDIDGHLNFSLECSNSDMATLSGIQVNGEALASFDPQVFSYEIELEPGTNEVPVLTAQSEWPGATLVINQAGSVNGTASIEVTSEDGSGILVYEVKFTVLVSVSEIEDAHVKLYPVPARDILYLEIFENPEGMKIFNSQGRLVREILKTCSSVDVSELTPGQYFLEIEFGDKTTCLKFLKIE